MLHRRHTSRVSLEALHVIVRRLWQSRGTPSGKQVTINGSIEGYLASASDAPSQKHIAVLYIPDIVGIWQNSKLKADAFAAEGFTCLVVDIFNGDPAPLNMPAGFDLMSWLTKGSDGKNPHTIEYIDRIVVEGIKYLKQLGYTSIAGAGYCLGAKVSPSSTLTTGRTLTRSLAVRRPPLSERHRLRFHRAPLVRRGR
jgi:dienelactone hydrolase